VLKIEKSSFRYSELFIQVRVEIEYSFVLGSDVMYVGSCSAVARGMIMTTWPHLAQRLKKQ